MRLFTAIDLPSAVKARIEECLKRLRPLARVHWSPSGNLHITSKFVGQWPEARLDELKAALAALPGRAPFEIVVRGLGWFPNPRSPRVLWAGIEAGEQLAVLAREMDAALALLGIPAESKRYSPHLTLARIKPPVPLDGLRKAIVELGSPEFGSFQSDRFWLYASDLRPSGSVYTKLAGFPFAR